MTRPEPDDLLRWVFERQRFGVHLGLERMRQLLDDIGRPDGAFRSVLVGGTNGKGSTAAVLAAALGAAGERVGLTTSPHLVRFAERFVVDGAPLPDETVRGALARVRPSAERLGATFFEIVTAAAVLLFADAGVDTAVLEVGLGGRFDATNAVEPVLSLITGVALDHVGVLGDTLERIAREKAGILRAGVPAWTGASGEALAALRVETAMRGARLRTLEQEVGLEVLDRGWQGLELELHTPFGAIEATTPLVGPHQARNVALALVGACELGVPHEVAALGAAEVRWPGRLERVRYRGRWLVLDGAHNPEAAAALARALASLEGRVPVMVLGVTADKDVVGVASALAGVAERVVATGATSSPRAMAPAALARVVGADAVAADPAEALRLAARWAGAGGTVVVAGSLFLVGEVRALVLGEPADSGERWQ
ncbi:MAG: bifunctional folylpolyglutamate synthase/dihydrofolate synthase [Deinococcales bacterium]